MANLNNPAEARQYAEDHGYLRVIKLETGRTYPWTNLHLVGWTEGDATGTEGYHVVDYFSFDGVYLGPDQHGIEPLFSSDSTWEVVNG